MIKLRQTRGRLKGLTKMILSSALLLFFVVGCDGDEGSNAIDEVLYIDGPASVTPESTVTFTAAEAGGSISWTVTGNATLSTTDGLTAEVIFGAVGTATVSASGSGLNGTRVISVDAVDAALVENGVSLSKSSVNNGGSETVTFTFAAPLASIPTAELTGDFTAATMSALTEVSGSDMTQFVATVTGGAGNGQLNVAMAGVTVDADFGGGTADLEAAIHTVDNVAPIGEFAVSTAVAKTGTEVTFMVTLNEWARANGDNMIIDVSGAGLDGTTQVMLAATDDAAIWSATVSIAGTDEGTMTAVLDESTVVDVAGNDPTEWLTATTGAVTIDNTAPTTTDLTVSTDVDNERLVSVVTTPEELGSTVHWIWLPYNSQFMPESPADFEGEGADDKKFVAGAGKYKLFYLEVDAAGNFNQDADGVAVVKRFPVLTGDQVEGDEDASIEIM